MHLFERAKAKTSTYPTRPSKDFKLVSKPFTTLCGLFEWEKEEKLK